MSYPDCTRVRAGIASVRAALDEPEAALGPAEPAWFPDDGYPEYCDWRCRAPPR